MRAGRNWCSIKLIYDPGDGRRQNAHSKEWLSSDITEIQKDIMGFSGPVKNPLTGELLNYVVGELPEFPPDHKLAGKGSKSKIRIIDDLVRRYGGKPDDWKHEKAFYWVYDEYGDERQVSIHWFEAPGCGKREGFVKLYEGKMYRDEYERHEAG